MIILLIQVKLMRFLRTQAIASISGMM